MNPWLETAGVLALGAFGAWLGRRCARFPGSWWVIGYLVPFLFILLVGVAHRLRTLELDPPVSWLMAGRREYALLALFGTVLLITPLSRLPQRRDRIAVGVLAAAVLVLVSAWPFVTPAFIHQRMQRLVTRVDADGVCLQGTDFNCGPAAAVTALRRLGLAAEEGDLAVLARTSPIHGTEPDVLALAITERYGKSGVRCDYRRFNAVDDLPRAGCTLALVKFGFLVDHYVVVLQVDAKHVIVGDPLSGREVLTRAEFMDRWRRVGIVLQRSGAGT